MARPRKSTGGKTSFGKRSEAEKSFRDKKKRSGRGDDERPRSKFTRSGDSESRPRPSRFGGSKPSFSRRDDDSGERPKRFSKPFERRDGGTGGPFRKRTSDSFQSRTGGGPSRFGKKPFQKRDEGSGDERPLKKRQSTSFDSRSDRPSRFTKKPFTKREDRGEDKPFRKRESGSFDSRSEKPSRFTKKPFIKREEGDEKPFRKRESRSFDSRKEGASRFEKKTFQKRGSESGEKKSFERREGEDKPFSSSNFGLPYKRKPYGRQRSESQPGRSRAEAKPKTDSDLIRLNKFMANSGVGSRREADELIKMGLVTVNGVTITEMGYKVKPTDEVRYEGKKLKAEKPVYILLNKPKGFITTTSDPQERNTVMNLVAGAGKERIYPVGRLDRNTTGLLLLTNDGDLADKLTHPSFNVKKIYKVELDKPITKNDFQKIKEGVRLEEGKAMVDDLAIVDDDSKTLGIELHIGWNRIVRRIFESLGYEVVKLDRVVYAGLDKKDLARGQWRFLKPEEIVMLKHFK
jgi:23S rRNA pseudouridine2605 synthase